MNWFNENLGESLFILGLILLSIEVLVLGFGTFVLFFCWLKCYFYRGAYFY